MTTTPDTQRREVRGCADTPCSDCPWRTSNQGKRHPDGWYTKANLRRLWVGLRNGELMTCHPTDPNNPVPPGWRTAPVSGFTRICAGATILQERELQRVNDIIVAGGTYRDYKRQNPMGLTTPGAFLLAVAVATAPGPGNPFTGMNPGTPNLNCAEVSYSVLAPWEVRSAT